MKRLKITRLVLWLFVLSSTFLLGGGTFEHLVLTPLWAGSPPGSVTQWQYGAVQAKFFGIFSSIFYLFLIATIITLWWMPPRPRRWAMVSVLCGIIVMIATLGFFIPILGQTQATGGAGLSGEEITRLTNQFVNWNYGRYVLLVGGWAAALRALVVSYASGGDEGSAKP